MKIIIIVLIVWNVILTLGIFKLMWNPAFTYYYPYFDRYGIWIFKTWTGAYGSGSGYRIFKWKFWEKDEE